MTATQEEWDSSTQRMNSKKEPIDKMTEESATLHATQLLEWIINDSKGSNKVGVHLETTKTKTKWSVQL